MLERFMHKTSFLNICHTDFVIIEFVGGIIMFNSIFSDYKTSWIRFNNKLDCGAFLFNFSFNSYGSIFAQYKVKIY